MNSIYNIYNESILDDIEVNIAKGEDDLINVEMEHIKTLLNDTNKFTFYSRTNPYTISKGKDVYYVDVHCSLTVYDFITDGTFKFNRIAGDFVVSNPKNTINKPLKSLEGAPEEVHGDFDIYYGYGLKDLKYCPKIVKGDVYIGNTEITSLKYFPKNVNGRVHIVENKQLKTLNDLQPCIIGNFLDFRNNAVVADLKDFKKWRIKYLNYSQITNVFDESILDDIDTQIENGDAVIRNEIEAFLKENYNIEGGTYEISDKPNKKGLYEVSGDKFTVTNKNIEQLTNDTFEFNFVRKFSCYSCKKLKSLDGAPKKSFNFYCSECINLTSLKGAPKEVTNIFSCEWCPKLKSLDGAPKKVDKFYCSECHSLKNLKGAPKEVAYFDCSFCENLESLEGGPTLVQADFNCEYNGKLKTLKGAPKEIGGTFNCSKCVHLETLKYLPFCGEVICFDCGKQFTEEEVKNWMMEKN